MRTFGTNYENLWDEPAHTYIHAYSFPRIHAYIHIAGGMPQIMRTFWTNKRTHTYIHTYSFSRIHACMHTYSFSRIHACINILGGMPQIMRTFGTNQPTHTYIHIRLYAYIHAYIHTCIHTYLRGDATTCEHLLDESITAHTSSNVDSLFTGARPSPPGHSSESFT